MALKRTSALESGLNVERTNYGETRLVAFCCAYLGDMPQQQDNAGFKRPTAKPSCRNCFVEEKQRDDLDYNIRKRVGTITTLLARVLSLNGSHQTSKMTC
jgi:hypothetical protein